MLRLLRLLCLLCAQAAWGRTEGQTQETGHLAAVVSGSRSVQAIRGATPSNQVRSAMVHSLRTLYERRLYCAAGRRIRTQV